ncbi:MAG: PadR family transcriptional regulator [Clostridiales bacterium]|nr:PadR family transcriptional regulator [Clostridiales bacterium]
MEESQLLRGVLEQCVLAIVARGETYGYEILTRLSDNGFENILEGTLYPVLTRLNKRGLLSCRTVKSPYGPLRKLYAMTPAGEEELKTFRTFYRGFTASTEKILFGEDDHEKDADL